MIDPVTLVSRMAPGARVVRAWPLTGGVSAKTTALELEHLAGTREQVVVREVREHDWKDAPGAGVELEYDLLRALQGIGLPVPRPRWFDTDDRVLILDLVHGASQPADFSEAAPEMGATLARIHEADVGPDLFARLPQREDPVPGLLEWLPPDDRVLRGAIQRSAVAEQRTLLHGDFWPGNLLWHGSQVVAVVDWEDAAVGDPLSDLACARSELFVATNQDGVDRFTTAYVERTNVDTRALPIWDLYVALGALASMDQWGLEPEVLARRQGRTRAFADRAAAELRAAAANAHAPRPNR
jgi:aminoglycoside phosphotransferase (APT) family kinase protein